MASQDTAWGWLAGVPADNLEEVPDGPRAIEALSRRYEAATDYLRNAFTQFASGADIDGPVRARYPYLCVVAEETFERDDPTQAFGFFPDIGVYGTTITRPRLFANYLQAQLKAVLANHKARLFVGDSHRPIPLHFAFPEGFHVEGDLKPERLYRVRRYFDLPDLDFLDDSIANGEYRPPQGAPAPLALFTAERVDYSLHRLQHYTATAPEHFQDFVLFTNYPFYVEEFVRFAREMMTPAEDTAARAERSAYTAFVEPGNVVTWNPNLDDHAPVSGAAPQRLPQMPAYHLKRADGGGITMVNIGIGPANAKTATDHIAVLRPHAWLMLGHCAGLRNTQKLGDYVLAHGYVRDDHVLDADVPLSVPVPALAEVQQALEQAVEDVSGKSGKAVKRLMRTGTVATIDNRNWELRDHTGMLQRLSQSRAIALDMESATIAANGFRFRVPYGTLLCVSDKPLHGELKLPGMANSFYRKRVGQHLSIGLQAMGRLRAMGTAMHSRKLRTFHEPAFR